ncbi:hypothetical protein A2U01_0074136, partial [Trifolium medium]|nr:hypothetical protein [Trifolium medium]
VVVEVELAVVQPSVAARSASSPYDASRLALAVHDTGGASPVVVATTEPTYFLQDQPLALLPPLHASLASRV